MEKKLKKVSAASLSALMVSTIAIPSFASAQESNLHKLVDNDVIVDRPVEDTPDLTNVDVPNVTEDEPSVPEIDENVMLELEQVDFDGFFEEIDKDLDLDSVVLDDENDVLPESGGGVLPRHPGGSLTVPTPTRPPLYDTDGLKSKGAKVAAKKMIKELKGIGPKVWNEKMKGYSKKLPISSKAQKTVAYYMSYQVLMETLNVVVDFEGTAQEGIKKGLRKMGCPAWLTGIIARGITTFLL